MTSLYLVVANFNLSSRIICAFNSSASFFELWSRDSLDAYGFSHRQSLSQLRILSPESLPVDLLEIISALLGYQRVLCTNGFHSNSLWTSKTTSPLPLKRYISAVFGYTETLPSNSSLKAIV